MKETNLETLRAATDAAHAAEIEGLERRLLHLRGQDESLANFGEFHAKHFGASKRGRPSGGKNKAKIAVMNAHAAGELIDRMEKSARVIKPKAKITPEQLASRQLQGKYLGAIRQIPAGERAQYQEIAKAKGRRAAVRAMKARIKELK